MSLVRDYRQYPSDVRRLDHAPRNVTNAMALGYLDSRRWGQPTLNRFGGRGRVNGASARSIHFFQPPQMDTRNNARLCGKHYYGCPSLVEWLDIYHRQKKARRFRRAFLSLLRSQRYAVFFKLFLRESNFSETACKRASTSTIEVTRVRAASICSSIVERPSCNITSASF